MARHIHAEEALTDEGPSDRRGKGGEELGAFEVLQNPWKLTDLRGGGEGGKSPRSKTHLFQKERKGGKPGRLQSSGITRWKKGPTSKETAKKKKTVESTQG